MQDYERIETTRLRKNFSIQLSNSIEELGMDVHRLSYESGICISALQAYLSGSRLPKVPQLVVLARVLDKSTDWLLNTYEDEHESPVLVEPSEQEEVVLTAIAVSNDSGEEPTFVTIGKFSGFSPGQVSRLVRRLEVAGWVTVDQAKKRHPSMIRVAEPYRRWTGEINADAAEVSSNVPEETC